MMMETRRRRGCAVIFLGDDGIKNADNFSVAAKVVFELRKKMIPAELIHGKSLKAMMRMADRMNFLDAIVLGDLEFQSGMVKVKDLEGKFTNLDDATYSLDEIAEVLIGRNSFEKR